MSRSPNPDRKTDKKLDAYKAEFAKQNYDTLLIYLPKGRRSIVREHAASRGESANAFITRAINNQIERDQAQSSDPSDD